MIIIGGILFDFSSEKNCEMLAPHLAILEIEIASPTMIQSRLSQRTTLANQIAILGVFFSFAQYRTILNSINSYFTGGTLGLFTGMSILSIVEVFYWLIKILASVRYFKVNKH